MAFGVTAIVGAAASVATGVIGAVGAGKRAKRSAREAQRLQKELEVLERNRQKIINPYEGVTDLSSMVQDLSSMITNTSDMLNNPFQNIGVATSAAEINAEQADISLAASAVRLI